MMNLVQKTVILASVILSTASGFEESVCGSFAVHGGTFVTFLDTTISKGDVGVSPGDVINGDYTIDDGEVASTANAVQFDRSAVNAFQEAMRTRNDAMPIVKPEIGGLTFTPGTWRSGTINMSPGTTVTLDGKGDRNSEFLMQASSTIIVGAGCKIVLINEAKVENVVWVAGTSFLTQTGGTDLKGSIMTGTAVTLGAKTVLEGSILAQTAVTLGSESRVEGCVVALTAVTFAADVSVTHVQAEPSSAPSASPSVSPSVSPSSSPSDAPSVSPSLSASPSASPSISPSSSPTIASSMRNSLKAIIDFPSFYNDDDELTIACLPLIEEAPEVCASLPIEADMEAMLNTCTQDGIKKALIAARQSSYAVRRMKVNDMPHVEGFIRMLPTEDMEEETEQEERELGRRRRKRMCHTTNPTFMTVLLCCFNKNSHSFCGSPCADRRRELRESEMHDDDGITAAEVEQYLPSIALECSTQFKLLATSYINTIPAATCFAAATDVVDLKCYALMVTGGDDDDSDHEKTEL